MPYDLHKPADNSPKYLIRFRGGAMIPRINQMAPCRVELTCNAIETILESLYRRPLLLEVFYVDTNGREWEINFTNYKKILPKEPAKEVEPPKTPKVSNEETDMKMEPIPVATSDMVVEKTEIPNATEEMNSGVVELDHEKEEVLDITKEPKDSSDEREPVNEDHTESNSVNPYSNQYQNNRNRNKHRH